MIRTAYQNTDKTSREEALYPEEHSALIIFMKRILIKHSLLFLHANIFPSQFQLFFGLPRVRSPVSAMVFLYFLCHHIDFFVAFFSSFLSSFLATFMSSFLSTFLSRVNADIYSSFSSTQLFSATLQSKMVVLVVTILLTLKLRIGEGVRLPNYIPTLQVNPGGRNDIVEAIFV